MAHQTTPPKELVLEIRVRRDAPARYAFEARDAARRYVTGPTTTRRFGVYQLTAEALKRAFDDAFG